MPHVVDVKDVSTAGLESFRVAGTLAGLRASEARYCLNKYGHVLTVNPAAEVPEELASRFKFARRKSKLDGVIRAPLLRGQGQVLTS